MIRDFTARTTGRVSTRSNSRRGSTTSAIKLAPQIRDTVAQALRRVLASCPGWLNGRDWRGAAARSPELPARGSAVLIQPATSPGAGAVFRRKDLGNGEAGETGGGEESVQAVSVTSSCGEPGQGSADKVRHALGLIRVAGCNVLADHTLRGHVEGSGCLARRSMLAAGAFQHKTASGGGIGGVSARGLLQYGRETCSRRFVARQELVEG